MALAVREKKETKKTIKRRINYFEDEVTYAQELSRNLDLGPEFQEVFFSNKKEINAHINGHHVTDSEVYVIDLNIGNDDENGLKRLKTLEERNPSSLKIIHTANPNIEQEALAAGADIYIPKDLDSYEGDVEKIKKAIQRFNNRKVADSDEIIMQSIKTRLVILEDDLETVQGYVESIHLGSNIKEIWIPNRKQIPHISWNDNEKLIFWVDIHLGIGKEKDGLAAIKEIKNIHPFAPVIVYTAYDVEEEARSVGADFFFQKDADTYLEDINAIKGIIIGLTDNLEISQLSESVPNNYRSDYYNYFEKTKAHKVAKSLEDTNITPLKLKITQMKGDINTAGYIYLSKKILSEPDESDTLWVAGKQVWQVNYEKVKDSITSILHSFPTQSKTESLKIEISYDSKNQRLINLKKVSNDGSVYDWDLSDLEKIDEKFKNDFKYNFSNLPREDKILFNIMVAQACVREFIIEGGNKTLAQDLVKKLNHIGKLESQKWLALYYRKENGMSTQDILNHLNHWVEKVGCPQILDVIKCKMLDENGETSDIELESLLYDGWDAIETWKSHPLTKIGINQNTYFTYTPFILDEDTHAFHLEIVDYI